MRLTHYEVLELERGVDKATITKKYRELALIWQPDRAKDWAPASAVADLTLISSYMNAAYDCLRDDDRRRNYDAGRPAALDNTDAEFREKKAALKPIYEAFEAAKKDPKTMFAAFELQRRQSEALQKQLEGYLQAQAYDAKKSSRLEEENTRLKLQVASLEKAFGAAEEMATARIQSLEAKLAQSQAQVALLQSQKNRTEAPIPIPEGVAVVPAAEAKTLPVKIEAAEPLSQNKLAISEARKKIMLKGLMYVVREVTIDRGEKEKSFTGITLIFSTKEEGLATHEDLLKMGLTVAFSKQEKIGDYTNDSRFFRLILIPGPVHDIANLDLELEGVLTLYTLERGVLISDTQKRVCDMSTGALIAGNVYSPRDLLDVECIVLSIGKFHNQSSKSFAGVTVIFKNAAAAKKFQKIAGRTDLSTTKPCVRNIVNFQNESRFVDLDFAKDSQLSFLSKKNLHLSGLLLLSLLEDGFKISEHEKVLYDEETDRWLLPKAPEKTAAAEAGFFSGRAPDRMAGNESQAAKRLDK